MLKRIALIAGLGMFVALAGGLLAQEGATKGPGMGPGGRGRSGRPMGPGPFGGMQGAADTEFFKSVPMAKSEEEKKILDVLTDLRENQSRGMMNVAMDDGRFLRVFAEMSGAKNVVEIGTSNGYSAIWFCLALRNTGGKLTTFEIDPGRAEMARQNFKRAGVDSIVTLVEGDAHETVAQLKDPIDILFLDADKEGYLDYLNKLLPLVRPGGVILAHNINPPQADPKYIEAITTNSDLETILVSMYSAGVSVTLKKR